MDWTWIIGIPLIGILWYWHHRAVANRLNALSEMARERGLYLAASPMFDESVFRKISAFKSLTLIGKIKPSMPTSINTIVGKLTIKGARYDTQAGNYTPDKRRDQAAAPYVLLRLPGANMPRLVVREEQIHHRFMEDIEFTGNDMAQKFNKRFYIKCQDESFAKKAIGSSMIALLLSKDDIHWIEFNKDLICLFRDPMGQSIREAFINDYSAGPLAELLDFIQEILAALPPSFVNDVSVDALGNLWI